MWAKKSKQKIAPKADTVAKRLDAIEAQLERIEKMLSSQQEAHSNWFESVTKNISVLYGKSVLTRLNLIELSKGEEVTLTDNEQKEINNFLSDRPSPNMLTFNKLIRKGKRTKH
ncbi:MAG: hypothetical protein EB060_09930 [Proteobacteria bacterium]|nr:hypothetical protein [Pseudomonadota bacterium]